MERLYHNEKETRHTNQKETFGAHRKAGWPVRIRLGSPGV
jgi:hypothetical protein